MGKAYIKSSEGAYVRHTIAVPLNDRNDFIVIQLCDGNYGTVAIKYGDKTITEPCREVGPDDIGFVIDSLVSLNSAELASYKSRVEELTHKAELLEAAQCLIWSGKR